MCSAVAGIAVEAGLGMQFAGSSRRAREAVRSADRKTSADRPPSWPKVLATTLSLWASRRLSRFPRPRGRSAILAVVIPVVAVAAAIVAVLEFTGSSAPAARSSSPGVPDRAGNGPGHTGPDAAAVVRSQAAAWVASQVGSNETIACDPPMCAALQAHGIAASRLLPWRAAATGPSGADVMVGSQASRAGLPVLLARFGSGARVIDVRAASPGGTAAYQSALRADLAARRAAGVQLLHSRRIQAGALEARQLQAGQVDSRLLVALAALASQQSWRVVAFGDASPGDQVPLTEAPFRQVTMTAAAGRGGAAGLAAAVAFMRAQRAPYQPAHVTIVRLASGQAGLRIEFAAPSPFGLLTGGGSG